MLMLCLIKKGLGIMEDIFVGYCTRYLKQCDLLDTLGPALVAMSCT